MDHNRKQPLVHLPTVESGSLHTRKIIAGRYELIARIGRGGMGEVWRALDVKLEMDVALKALRLDLRTRSESMDAFRSEVRLMRQIASPNVCRIYDLVVDEDLELIAMEFIDGNTLLSLLENNKTFLAQESRSIVSQFLAGLEAIHQQGIVHRDLKPENIMVTSSGRAVVMDFGLVAKALERGGVITGTPAYMSPEQQAGEPPDARSDVFSAGFIIAEFAYCQMIPDQSTREELWNLLRRNPRLLPDHPWKEIIVRAAAREPSQRFSSARELRVALEEVADSPALLTRKEENFTRAVQRNETRTRRRRQLAAILAICVAITLAFIVNSLWMREQNARKIAHASRLLSLARLKADQNPSEALAFATASLKMSDTQEARLFALELISRNPVALYAPINNNPAQIRFSPDGNWVGVTGRKGISVISSQGSITFVTRSDVVRRGELSEPHFLTDGEHMTWRDRPESQPQMFSLRSMKIVPFAIPAGQSSVRLQVTERIATTDNTGRILLFADMDAKEPIYVFPQSQERVDTPRLSPNGNLLAAVVNQVRLWRLNAPLDADPLTWSAPATAYAVAFDLQEQNMALALSDRLAFYSLSRSYPYTLHGNGADSAENLTFTPDGKTLIAGLRYLYSWSLPGEGASIGKQLSTEPSRGSDVDPSGTIVLAGSMSGAHLISIADGSRKKLPGSPQDGNIVRVSFSPDGKFAAGVPAAFGPASDQVIRIWELSRDAVHFLEPSRGMSINALKMISDSSLVTGGADGNVLLWDLKTEKYRSLFHAKKPVASLSVENSVLVASFGPASEPLMIHLITGMSRSIQAHGNAVKSVALDTTGTILVTGDSRGIVRVGPVDGDEPHILFGLPPAEVWSVAIDSKGHWIAGSVNNATVCLWEMPKGVPFQKLRKEQLMQQLEQMTNVRVIEDPQASGGYRAQLAPFPGWRTSN